MDDIVDRLRIAETAPLDADGKVSLCLVLQDARAEIARLREERRWIAVTERLPPDNVAVLVNHDSGGVEMAFREGGRWNISHAGVSVPDCSYTHWMPLPAPPSEGEVE